MDKKRRHHHHHHKSRSEKKKLDKKIKYIKDLIDQAEVLTVRNERLSNEEKYHQLIKTRDAISDYLRLRLSGSALMLLCTDLEQEEHRAKEKRLEEELKTVQLDGSIVHKFDSQLYFFYPGCHEEAKRSFR